MRRFTSLYRFAACTLAVSACSAIAQADNFNFQMPGEASALVTTGAGTITITLTDLYVNPTAVSDNLSAFWFTTSVTPSSVSINSSSAAAIDIAGNGAYSNQGTVAPGWALTLAGAVTKLDDLGSGGAGPAHTIVGAPDSHNVYSAANASIAGNGPHNAFLDETATWTLNAAGVTSSTTISGATFMFGTTENSGFTGQGGALPPTPEPASLWMLALGGSTLLMLGRRLRPGTTTWKNRLLR